MDYPARVWYTQEILCLMSHHLQSIDSDLRAQQAYLGLDSYPEIQLHPLLCQAFAASHYGTLREVGYPSSPRDRPNEAQRQRCDLVLTPGSDQPLFDPIHEQREQDKALGTLFEAFSSTNQPDPNEVVPQSAFWLEVKSVAQFCYVDGVPGTNGKYTSELLSGPRSDVLKLATEPMIHHAAALVILFSQDQATGPHDIMAAVNEMIESALPISIPELESFPITDHAGNAWCTLGLIPMKL